MPQRTNTFQQLIFLIHRQLDREAVVTESKFLTDRLTGHTREVDVVIESKAGGYPITISVECVGTERPADETWVEQTAAKHQHLPTNRLVLVSRAGFTSGAKETAAKLGHATMQLKEAEGADWATMLHSVSQVRFAEIYCDILRCAVVLQSDRGCAVVIEQDDFLYDSVGKQHGTVKSALRYAVYYPNVVQQILDQMDKDKTESRRFSTTVKFRTTAFASINGSMCELEAIRFIFEIHIKRTVASSVGTAKYGDSHVLYAEGATETGGKLATVTVRDGEPLTASIMELDGEGRPVVDLVRLKNGKHEKGG